MTSSQAVCLACKASNDKDALFCLQCGEALLEGRVAGSYRLVSPLGSGGMGAVYRAEHVRMGTPFAVKVLHRRLAKDEKIAVRFLREAKATSQLQHEHIVFIADYGEMDPYGPYIAMEFLKGQPLSGAKSLNLHELSVISQQLCDAMEYSHSQGMVHRDLKPDNVFLMERSPGKDPFLKVLDFGIAKAMEEESQKLTKTGAVLGTPVYMAPEQGIGEKTDERADIYALSTMMYQLLVGRPPFVGESVVDLLSQRMYKEAPPISTFCPMLKDTQLESALVQGLRKNVVERTATMGALKASLSRGFVELSRTFTPEAYRTPVRVLFSRAAQVEPTAEDFVRPQGTMDVPPPKVVGATPSGDRLETGSEYFDAHSETSLPTPSLPFSEKASLETSSPKLSSAPMEVYKASTEQIDTGPIASSSGLSSTLLFILGGLVLGLVVLAWSWGPWGKKSSSNQPKALTKQVHPKQGKNGLEVKSTEVVARKEPLSEVVLDASGDDDDDDDDEPARPSRAIRKNTRRKPRRRFRKRQSSFVKKFRRVRAKRQPPVQPRPMKKRVIHSKDGCPANSGGTNWVRLMTNEKTVTVRVNGKVVRRNNRVRGWCLPVRGRTSVSVDGIVSNLALCEFKLRGSAPRTISVTLLDSDDQSPGSYCYKK